MLLTTVALSGISTISESPVMVHKTATVMDLADAVAVRNGLDPKLVRAIVTVESSWRPGAVSRKGAIGLLQVHHPTWGHKWNRRQLRDPEQNLMAGTTILKGYIERSLSLREALHKYSGGARNYYERVMKEMEG